MAEQDGATTPAREVALKDWGKVILEEILFRAARDLSERGVKGPDVTVALEFRLAPDEAGRTIEIAISGAVETLIKTRLPLDP